MRQSTTRSLPRLPRFGRSLTIAGLAFWTACAVQPGPETGPSPASEAPDAGQTAPLPSSEDAARGGRADDPSTGEADAAFVSPTPEEIDRVIRETLGDDPLELVGSPEGRKTHLPLEINERVDAWIHYFQSVIPERFGLYLQRKTRYEAMIRRKLREAGMPQDIIYLALIESGMNPRAYSRAHAVGMWQFISGTARMYDLEVSFWVDERRDPEKATDAALRYLSDLYDEFGSWYLAMAAYNGGPGRIRRGLARTDGDTFWDLAEARLLRRETTNYVPKLIAAAIIGHDPARYGFGDIEPELPPAVETVTVPDATSFDVLAEAADTDEETIRDLNPHFPRRVTPPGRSVEVRIPAGRAETFRTRYAAVPPDERVTWTFHVVARGQTLSQIARNYGVSVSALRGANGNVNPRRLQIGQRLVVPNPARVASRGSSDSSTRERARTSRGPVTIVVERGDSLWAIARRYSVS
ncbi:MAG: transglycosylase SLT domain-containing protein, partial [Gemmatimonadota bacterium]|nr:transglycosylase SLT domain-containing protein [Gemmatimonadota bacterium]